MADAPSIRQVIHLPPEEAVRAFEARDALRTTVQWHEMWGEEHSRAFTVAKVARLDLLETIRGSLDEAGRNGMTFEQWQAQLQPELEKAGWWGRVQDKELTGTSRPVLVGPRRLRTIYDTNMRVSRAAGHWARIQELKKVAPYLRYSSIRDRRTRPAHRRWHGTILPVDHPWWDTHFPPCGWNCRCTVQQLSERDLKRYGWQPSKRPPDDGPPRGFWRAGAEKPEAIPAGISPGFAYNPGKTAMRAIADKAAASIERTAGADIGLARGTLGELVESRAFLKAMDEPGSAFPVMVLDDAVRSAIGAEARTVMLSAETFAKQQRRHPEIGIDLYRRLPGLAEAPTIVARDGRTHLILAEQADKSWLVAVIKRTVSGAASFLQSLRRQEPRSLKRLLRDKDVVRDDRGAS